MLKDGTDLHLLAKAVAWQETHDCTKGFGKSHNNCHGLLSKGKPMYYKDPSGSYKYFYGLWANYYGEFPNEKTAKRYSGGDRSKTWLRNVTWKYNQLSKT